MDKRKITSSKDIMKEPLNERLTCREGENYPIANIGDQPFEALTYFLFKYSEHLKKEYGHKNVLLIKGGSDKGRDVIAFDEERVNLVIQCKHSEDPRGKHALSMLMSELLKMILYIHLDKNLVCKESFTYVFVISNNVKSEDVIKIKNFNNELISDDVLLKKEIKKLKKGYKAIERGITEISDNVLSSVREIGKRMTVDVLQNVDVQPLISTIPVEYIEYFFKVKVVEVIKPEIPNISDKEINIDVKNYENKRFYVALEKVEAPEMLKAIAISDFSKRVEAITKLSFDDVISLEDILEEYESEITTKNIEDRIEALFDISEEISDKKMKKESVKFYMKFMKEVSANIKLRGFGHVPNFFPKGTCHDLVNEQKIEEWYLGERED